jgi:hypothetical protein
MRAVPVQKCSYLKIIFLLRSLTKKLNVTHQFLARHTHYGTEHRKPLSYEASYGVPKLSIIWYEEK